MTLDSVQATLADGVPRTEAPPFDTALAKTAFIAVEVLSLPHQQSLRTVIVFAGKHLNDHERAVALLHAMTTETANELMVLRQAPFLAAAFAEIECGVTIADPKLADTILIYANAAFERMSGYSRAEVLGRNCRFLQGDLQDQPGASILGNALARGTDCIAVVTNFRKNGEALRRDLEALSAMGVRLSLDDFGTGYSSLEHLNEYFFDEIKIDQSFVCKLGNGAYAQAIVRAVIIVAAAIDADVVAEGLELANQPEAVCVKGGEGEIPTLLRP